MPKEKPREMVDRLLSGNSDFNLVEIEKLLKKLGFRDERERSSRHNKKAIPNQPFYAHESISNLKIAFPVKVRVIPESFFELVRSCINAALKNNPNLLDRLNDKSSEELSWENNITESRSNNSPFRE